MVKAKHAAIALGVGGAVAGLTVVVPKVWGQPGGGAEPGYTLTVLTVGQDDQPVGGVTGFLKFILSAGRPDEREGRHNFTTDSTGKVVLTRFNEEFCRIASGFEIVIPPTAQHGSTVVPLPGALCGTTKTITVKLNPPLSDYPNPIIIGRMRVIAYDPIELQADVDIRHDVQFGLVMPSATIRKSILASDGQTVVMQAGGEGLPANTDRYFQSNTWRFSTPLGSPGLQPATPYVYQLIIDSSLYLFVYRIPFMTELNSLGGPGDYDSTQTGTGEMFPPNSAARLLGAMAAGRSRSSIRAAAMRAAYRSHARYYL